MNFLQNFKIGRKLAILLLLPFLGIVYFSTQEILTKYRVVETMKKVDKLAILSAKIGMMVHETQKERGATGGFLGNAGKAFKTELSSQRIVSDHRISDLNNFLKGFNENAFDDIFKMRFSIAMNDLRKIENIRASVDNLSILRKDGIDYYTTMHANFLDVINYIAIRSSDLKILFATTAYANFFSFKESAGIERAIMTDAFAYNQVERKILYEISGIVDDQKSFIDAFKKYATKEQVQFYDQTVSGEIVDETDEMRAVYLSANQKSELSFDLNKVVGFGGLIHHFKNYILRGDDRYLHNFSESYDKTAQSLTKFETLPFLSGEDKKNIETIWTLIKKYQTALKAAIVKKSAGASILETDKEVKIDDSEAIEAFSKMMRGGSFGVSPLHWFKTMTAKINLMKRVEDKILDDLVSLTTNTKDQAIKSLILYIIFIVILFIVTFFLTITVTRAIVNPIQKLTLQSYEIARGRLGHTVEGVDAKDETGELARSFNEMTKNLKQYSDDNIAFKEEREKRAAELSKSNLKLEEQAKLKVSILELNDKMRGDLEPEQLGKNILNFLVDFLDAQIGTFYIANENDTLKTISTYAHSKSLIHEVKFGEGLVGQAALDKKAVIINDIPEDYFKVNSSLGETKPRNIFLYPVISEQKVKGVLEIGSVNEYTQSHIDFLNQVNENIGINLNGVLVRTKMKELLEESQQQAEELQSQQEELRTANEELEELAMASKESDRGVV